MNQEEQSRNLIIDLYKEGYIQTLWNAVEHKNRAEGWWLKSGIWSPWFFNMRHVGSSPKLFYDICCAMADMISQHDVNLLIGVEMTGLPLAGGIAIALTSKHRRGQPIGFTRPLSKKARTALEALQLLQDSSDIAVYGQKSLVEARLHNNDIVSIIDDMATDLESKIIARLLVLKEADRQNIKVQCNKIFYLLNRNKQIRQKGLNFINEKELQLYPAALEVNYIIEFDEALPFLRSCMAPEEYEAIIAFQENKEQFQDEKTRKELIKIASG
ncbi:MAG: hypothetical protein HQL06_03980 [Nitrospirae bacterium]|nr:hypothetical protein [Nitrospirota bacterium]